MTEQLDLFPPAPLPAHDPLCTCKDLHPELCDCEVIAKARADERAKVSQAVEACLRYAHASNCIYSKRTTGDEPCRCFVIDTIAAARGEWTP